MNFYYDPILGLQYNFIRMLFEIDLCAIPTDLSIQDMLEMVHRQGVMFVDSDCNNTVKEGLITNYML